MQHFQSLDPLHLQDAWITIGSFDGVHLGHQKIVNQLTRQAHAQQHTAVVVTFFPHPAVVLGKGANVGYLTTPEERAELLGELDVDVVVTLPFTRELASFSANEFMQRLVDHLGVRHLLVGYDFALGRGREGNVERLREIGQSLGYTLDVHHPVEADHTPISSSHIRKLIRAGEVQAAANLLGRNYKVTGTVVHGDGRGKALGFPTANLDYWNERVMPANGVYVTWIWIDGIRYPSVSNFGLRPTFDQVPETPLLEGYIIDYAGDLYGKTVELEFITYLRPELKFDSVADLIEQMHRDTQKSLEVLQYER